MFISRSDNRVDKEHGQLEADLRRFARRFAPHHLGAERLTSCRSDGGGPEGDDLPAAPEFALVGPPVPQFATDFPHTRRPGFLVDNELCRIVAGRLAFGRKILLYELKSSHAAIRAEALAAKAQTCTHPLSFEAPFTTVQTTPPPQGLVKRASNAAATLRRTLSRRAAAEPDGPIVSWGRPKSRSSVLASVTGALEPLLDSIRGVVAPAGKLPSWTLAEQDHALKRGLHGLGWRQFGRGLVGKYKTGGGHEAIALEARISTSRVPPRTRSATRPCHNRGGFTRRRLGGGRIAQDGAEDALDAPANRAAFAGNEAKLVAEVLRPLAASVAQMHAACIAHNHLGPASVFWKAGRLTLALPCPAAYPDGLALILPERQRAEAYAPELWVRACFFSHVASHASHLGNVRLRRSAAPPTQIAQARGLEDPTATRLAADMWAVGVLLARAFLGCTVLAAVRFPDWAHSYAGDVRNRAPTPRLSHDRGGRRPRRPFSGVAVADESRSDRSNAGRDKSCASSRTALVLDENKLAGMPLTHCVAAASARTLADLIDAQMALLREADATPAFCALVEALLAVDAGERPTAEGLLELELVRDQAPVSADAASPSDLAPPDSAQGRAQRRWLTLRQQLPKLVSRNRQEGNKSVLQTRSEAWAAIQRQARRALSGVGPELEPAPDDRLQHRSAVPA